MEEFRTSYLLDCNMEYVLWDVLRNFFQPSKQCYQSCQSFHYLSIRREINRKDFDKYNREKSKYSKYKVMVDQIKRLNRFFRFYFTLFGMIFTFLSTKNLKNNYFFQKSAYMFTIPYCEFCLLLDFFF